MLPSFLCRASGSNDSPGPGSPGGINNASSNSLGHERSGMMGAGGTAAGAASPLGGMSGPAGGGTSGAGGVSGAASVMGGGAGGLALTSSVAQQMGMGLLEKAGHRMAARRRVVVEVARLARGDVINGLALFGKPPVFHAIASSQV